jgi:hypothetical protein
MTTVSGRMLKFSDYFHLKHYAIVVYSTSAVYYNFLIYIYTTI